MMHENIEDKVDKNQIEMCIDENTMKEQLIINWDNIMDLMGEYFDVSQIIMETWIKPLNIYDIKNNVIYLYIDEKRGKQGVDYLRKKGYDSFLLSAIREFFNIPNIELTIDEKYKILEYLEGDSDYSIVADGLYSVDYYEAIKNSNLMLDYVFENFIISKMNRHVYAICHSIAELPIQDVPNPLVLYGGSRNKRIYLIQAIANLMLQNNPFLNVLYVSPESFSNDVIAAVQNNNLEKYREKYKCLDVLIINDIQEIIGMERIRQELFYILNYLYGEKRNVILSSDNHPEKIEGLEELCFRLEFGFSVDIRDYD